MQEDSVIINILSIAGAGLIILITGIVFLIFRDYIQNHIQYFLPVPPIAVAAYIFVYNMYQQKTVLISGKLSVLLKEVLMSVGIVSISFAVFTILLILFIDVCRRLIR